MIRRYESFATRMRQAIAASRYAKSTQKELGTAFGGISDVAVNYYLNGKKMPSMDTALVICERLDVCVEWLLTGRGPRTPHDIERLIDTAGLTPSQVLALRAAIDALRTIDDQSAPDKSDSLG